jgi:hypothetical protein
MKENVNTNIQTLSKNSTSKTNKLIIQKLKNKEFFEKQIYTPSELLQKKQNNFLSMSKKMEPKIIEFLNTKDFTC